MDNFLREWWKATLLATTWSLHWLASMGKDSLTIYWRWAKVRLMIGLDHLESLCQPRWFYGIRTDSYMCWTDLQIQQMLSAIKRCFSNKTADKQWRVLNWFVCLLLLLLIALDKYAFLQFYNFLGFLWSNFIFLNWFGIIKEAIMLSTFEHTWLMWSLSFILGKTKAKKSVKPSQIHSLFDFLQILSINLHLGYYYYFLIVVV